MLNSLVKLADYLDSIGETISANKIDNLIKKVSEQNPEYEKWIQEQEQDDVNARLLEEHITTNLKDALKNVLNVIKEAESNGIALYSSRSEELLANLLYFVRDIGKQVELAREDWAKDAKLTNIFEKLASIADNLDSIGAKDEADKIDAFIQKYSKHEPEMIPTDPDEVERLLSEQKALEIKSPEDVLPEDPIAKHLQEKRYLELIHMLTKALEQEQMKNKMLFEKSAADNKSNPYDYEGHHDTQIQEPEKPKKHKDLEHHIKTYQPHGGTLSIRHCPDHIGVSLARVSESSFQCPLDGKIYNWETGWTDMDGKQHSGGSVAGQTPDSTDYGVSHRMFDSRESAINTINS